MALARLPGRCYLKMTHLIITNRVSLLRHVFSPELLTAICWEESFFNNVKQTKGTAVGFGQTEPSEFWKLETNVARNRGYYVGGLPRRYKLKVGDSTVTKLNGTLTDQQSIRVMSAMLCQLYYDVSQDVQKVLEAYGGVPFSRHLDKLVREGKMSRQKADKIDPRGVAGRQKIIQDWRTCEKMLKHDLPDDGDTRPKIMEALSKAKAFPKDDPRWKQALFPEEDRVWGGGERVKVSARFY